MEAKQSFKCLSVYISIKYRKPQSIKKLFIPFNFFAQTAFSIEFLIHFIRLDAISIPISIQQEQEDILFYFISFEIIKIKNVLKLRILLYFSSNKRSIPLVSPPEYTPTKQDLSPDISPEPIFIILRYYICHSQPYLPGLFLSDHALGGAHSVLKQAAYSAHRLH